jgi:hypothetical protein
VTQATTVGGRSPVTVRRVVRTAWTIYRRHFALLAVMSLVVFSVLAVAESIVEMAIERRADDRGGAGVVEVGLWVVSGLWMFGSALFGGLCDTIVGKELGHNELPLTQAWKRLPFARLLGLDIVVTLAVTVGIALLVVPGIIVFTLTCIAAPLVMIEDRGIRAAVVRSIQLVRPRVALALAVVTAPVLIEHEAVHAIEALFGLPFLALIILNLAGMVLVLAPVSLCEVVLAHALIEIPSPDTPPPRPSSGVIPTG